MSSGSHRLTATAPKPRVLAYIVLALVTVALAVAAWVLAFRAQPDSYPVACGLPAAGEPVASTMIAGEQPTRPAEVPIRVLNANGSTGEATAIAEILASAGFSLAPDNPYGNDELVPDQNLPCFGQLRFSPQHNASAVALHAVFPCFELVHDARQDPSVDIALGMGFDKLESNGLLNDTIAALNNQADPNAANLESLGASSCA